MFERVRKSNISSTARFLSLVFVAGIIVGCTSEQDTSKEQAEKGPESATSSSISALERTYVSAAGSYLGAANEKGTELALVMAGASTGESTLGMIKRSIERTKNVLDTVYLAGYQTVVVPKRYAELDQKIRDCHRLHNDSFEEYLKYWKDDNPAHIVGGTDLFEKAVKTTNECIDDLNILLE